MAIDNSAGPKRHEAISSNNEWPHEKIRAAAKEALENVPRKQWRPFLHETEDLVTEQEWKDFAHTVEVLIATGRAEYEIEQQDKQ